jgi:hypothetical protein
MTQVFNHEEHGKTKAELEPPRHQERQEKQD